MSNGVVGLTNIGNTCYGNATLQAIRHQVDLTIYMLEGKHLELTKKKAKSEKIQLLESYGELLNSLWKGKGVIQTRPFWNAMIPVAIKEGFGHFRAPLPHDAHEFLIFLLDQFHEALSEEVRMTIQKVEGQTKDVSNALEFWKKTFEKSYSPFVELLFGLMRKSVVCGECKNDSVTWETMNITEVCVSDSKTQCSIIDLMTEHCKEEVIEDYVCDCCAPKRTRAVKSLGYWRLGNWVIITLKRNANNGNKINTHVDIPKTICFKDVFHNKSEEVSSKASYELFATINHHGSSRGGHYTSHAKHSVLGKWFLYDDEHSIEVPDISINSSTYIVMYRQT